MSPREIRHRAVDVLAVVAFVFAAACLTREALAGVRATPGVVWALPAVVLAAWVAADFASGFVHWLADTYGSPETPLLGPKLVTPFRRHHEDPEAIARHDFLEAHGDNCLISQLVLAPTWLFVPVSRGGAATALGVFVVALATSVLLTSMVHGWAHRRDPPRVVAWLQRANVVLSPDHHARHHAGSHGTHYCITSGWLNPVLDGTRFFRRLERLFAAAGIRPAR